MQDPDLLTFRQYLFLRWLFKRKVRGKFCNLKNIDIDCYNCLKQNEICRQGVIPASYFYKKTSRQYYDTKRVLDSLKDEGYIIERNIEEAKDFRLFYEITPDGIEFFKIFKVYYWIENE